MKKDNCEEKETSVERILALGMDKLKNSADVNCSIGEKINVGDITLVPISKVSAGYVSGGGEYGDKKLDPMVSGGSGGGYSVAPVGFIYVNNKTEEVKILPMDCKNAFEKTLEILPKIISNLTTKDGKKK